MADPRRRQIEKLYELAVFLESHGRDEGGYSDETRRGFLNDATELRAIAAGLSTPMVEIAHGLSLSIAGDDSKRRWLLTPARARALVRAFDEGIIMLEGRDRHLAEAGRRVFDAAYRFARFDAVDLESTNA